MSTAIILRFLVILVLVLWRDAWSTSPVIFGAIVEDVQARDLVRADPRS